jgi:cell division protein FtsQ
MKGGITLRIVAWAVALTLVALPVIGVMQGWFAAGRWPIRELTVSAEYRHVSAAQIRAAVLPWVGKGFFATDLDDVQKAVAALPWVESVEARKRWPDTLVLRVYERQPFAHWNGTQLISRQGALFAAPGGASVSGLPQLSGPDARMADVVGFYARAQRAFAPTGLRVTGIRLSGRDSWALILDSGAEVVIGRDQPEQRLQRFLDVYPQLVAGHPDRFAYADLRYTNGFALRWPDPTPVPTDAPGGAPRS